MGRVGLFGRSLVGVAGSKTAGDISLYLSLVSICFQVEVSTMGRLFVQRISTECGVPEYDLETPTMRRLGPTRGCRCLKLTFWRRN